MVKCEVEDGCDLQQRKLGVVLYLSESIKYAHKCAHTIPAGDKN